MSKMFGGPDDVLPLIKNPNISSRQFNAIVRNYINVHEALDRVAPDKLKEGQSWYERANEQAERIGRIAGGDTRMGAGIIAALSPQKNWTHNLDLAEELVKTGNTRHFTGQADKARRIMSGEDPLDVLKGPKERPFFINVNDPDDPSTATIDRHAHDQGIGREMGQKDRGLGTIGRVNIFNNALMTASRHQGYEVPSRFQASLWVPWSEGIRPVRANNFLTDYPSPDAADAHVPTEESQEPGPGPEST